MITSPGNANKAERLNYKYKYWRYEMNTSPMDNLLDKIDAEYDEIIIDWQLWQNSSDKQYALNLLIAHGYVKITDTEPMTDAKETYALAGYMADPIRNYEYSKLKSDGKGGYTALLCEQNTNIYIVAHDFILGDYTWNVDKSEYFYDRDLAVENFDKAPRAGL